MLSEREKKIGIVAAAVIGLLLADQLLLTPLLEMRDALGVRQESLARELDAANALLRENQKAKARLRELQKKGLASDPSAAESRLLNSLREWSAKANLKPASTRPDRAAATQGLHELVFQANAEGSMKAVSRFLYEIQRSDIPVRVSEVQIASRKDDADDLTVQLRVSTAWDETRVKVAAEQLVEGVK